MHSQRSMSNVIREYVRNYLSLVRESKASKRSAKFGAAADVFNILKNHFEKLDKNLVFVSAASQGSKNPDLVVSLGMNSRDDDSADQLPALSSANTWHIEVKSFNTDTKLGVEMKKGASAIRDLILSPSAETALSSGAQSQIERKLSAYPDVLQWAQEALSSESSSMWPRAVNFGDNGPDKDIRFLKVVKGAPNNWNRLRSAGLRLTDTGTRLGQYRSFYSISNVDLDKQKKDFTEKDLELAIQLDFSSKGDDVLILHSAATGTIRCFSLTAAAADAFGFPMFASESGSTIKAGSPKVTSTGGGGRIGIVLEVERDSGTLIS